MRIIKPDELKAILAAHKLWLNNERGARANLTDADLTDVDLTRANLTDADLTDADLRRANLTGVNLTDADLTGADLDFSSWPLWCGSLKAKLDQKQKRQLLYHALAVMTPKERKKYATKAGMAFVNKFHRRKDNEVPELEAK